MAMTIRREISGKRAELRLSGRCDFTEQREFRQSRDGALQQPSITPLEVGLGEVNYIDNSSLGAPLLLKEEVECV